MAVASNTSFLASIEKLTGRANYNEWKFATKAYLEHEKLWKCVVGEDQNEDNNVKAKSKLILLIHPTNFSHIQQCDSAKDIWDALSTAFDDSGLSRRVTLMRTLTSARLEQCDGMENYVNLIMNTVHKLRGIDCKVSEDWVGTFLLAGLPEAYQPMIMAVENSGIAITGDSIKTKLLQDANSVNNFRVSSSSALTTMGCSNTGRRGPRCFTCNEYGHIALQCRKQQQKDVSASTHNNAPSNSNRQGAHSNFATGFFAGFVGQGNINRTHDSDASGSLRKGQGKINRFIDSDASVHNHSQLQRQSIGCTIQSNSGYDPKRYVYVDDVFSFSSNSNLVGDGATSINSNSVATARQESDLIYGASSSTINSNSVATARQESDLIYFNNESINDDWTDSDDDSDIKGF